MSAPLRADEAFLKGCPPDVRRRFGVYFTPREVVGAQVRLVDSLLRQRLHVATGFADERVLIVDPACGGGAYPLAIQEHTHISSGHNRMRLYEALPEAAALAELRGLPVQRCDVLASHSTFQAPLVVCIGNPPYRRGMRQRTIVDDLREQAHGLHAKSLYNEYVYFWRWSLRVTFEQRRGPGVVCLLTAASYLRGPAFVGLRRLLRCVLDELWIIDLEGDQRAARATDNVFPIRTPVAIALGVRYGAASAAAPADVHFTRLGGSAGEKLSSLDTIREVATLEWQPVASGWTQPLVGTRVSSAYPTWPALTELFPWQLSGAQLKRTWPIGVTSDVLRARWRYFMHLPASQRETVFGPTRDRSVDSSPPGLWKPERLDPLRRLAPESAPQEPVRYAYRAFDRQWVLPDSRLGDFMRPALWRISGPDQVFLTTMLTNVLGPGPAAVATALVPDLDHFRGSFGARGVIPLWRDRAGSIPNVAGDWLSRVSQCYGFPVTAPQLLAYCYALLAAPSYTRRFDEELRTPGPHIPLTTDAALFRHGVSLGDQLIRVHTHREVKSQQARVVQSFASSFPGDYGHADETLWVGDGRIASVAPEVWHYSVSGYRVLPAWLRRRIAPNKRSPLDEIVPDQWNDALTRELLELVWLLETTIALGPALDDLLAAVISGGNVERRISPAQQQVANRVGSQRAGEDETLAVIAPELLQAIPL